MPMTIKQGMMKYKDPVTGNYVGIDTVAEEATADQIAAIQAKGTEVAGEIEAQYGTLITDVSQLKSAINAKQTAPASGSAAGKVLGLTEVSNELVPTWVDQPTVPVTDVQVNGISVLNQGVANVPVATADDLGVIKIGGYGLKKNSSSLAQIDSAASSQIKAGSNQNNPIVPAKQHESAFYALAKLAGADMASLSGETVGVYPEAQKIAIQKMLGIYQAPWELIREDTVTNATEADVEITVDGNGQAFELTDVFLVVYTSSDTGSAKADYGRIRLFYGSGNEYSDIFVGGAMSAGQTGIVKLIQEENAVFKSASQRATTGTNSYVQLRNDYRGSAYAMSEPIDIMTGVRAYTSINITKVTGGFGYKLYGKRKWN